MVTNSTADERKCRHCDEAAHLRWGKWLCARHHRYAQMCQTASRLNKLVPTYEEMDAMPGADLICPTCDVQMNWFQSDGEARRVASLQHYRDGSLEIVCVACNTRHAAMPGDDYRSLPKGHKRCPQCGEVKPFAEFYFARWGNRPLKISSWCKPCKREARLDRYRTEKQASQEIKLSRHQTQKES